MSYWSVPPLWAGETVCILGCGPSRNLVDMRALRASHHKVIAINDSIFAYPDADLLWFCDLDWWEARKQKVYDTWNTQCGRNGIGPCGLMATLENQIPGVFSLMCSGVWGFDPNPSCLRHGSNSGYQSIHLTAHLGAKRIILFGYDLRVVDGQLHAEARPERQDVNGFSETLEVMLEKFPSIVEPLKERGVEVLNASPGSKLKCWPVVEPASVL